MSYKKGMSDRAVARAAMKIKRENASLIADANDSNRAWNLIAAVDYDNDEKPRKDRL